MKLILLILLSWTLTGKIKAQDTLTYAQVFDFEVGDVFHYEHGVWGSSAMFYYPSIREVIDKEITPDSVIYTFLRTTPTLAITTRTFKIRFSALTWATTLLSAIDAVAIIHGFHTSIDFDGRQINSIQYTDSIPDHLEPETCSKKYAEGLGETFRNCSTVGGPDELILVYFKKGNIEWGTPTLVNSALEQSIKLYPNPFQDNIYLELTSIAKSKPAHLELFDTSGKSILKMDISGNEIITIPLNHIPSGTYLLHLKIENAVAVKLIMKE